MRGKFFRLTGPIAAALLLAACGNVAPTPSPPPNATDTDDSLRSLMRHANSPAGR